MACCMFTQFVASNQGQVTSSLCTQMQLRYAALGSFLDTTELSPESEDLVESLGLTGSRSVAHPCWTSVKINCFMAAGTQLEGRG